ncbi:MAG: nucleoside transporter C-terminal domain-containing protein [Roseibium album]|uniref:NupC/NupG family nucleoside CNT transporter n=1 Tax=Roseibium album TaxID=311410 RepID=UPI0032EB0DC2
MQAILGIGFLMALAWLLSESRGDIRWRTVATGLVIQFTLALVLLGIPAVSRGLLALNEVVYAVEAATLVGAGFVFGYLGGAEPPFPVDDPGSLYIFAFRVLPQIIVFSVLVAILWYWRVLPAVVRGFGAVLRRLMDVGGAVGTAAAASVFLGMVETPLVVRGYLKGLSRSELFTLMTCGMSTVAGSIMVLYANVLLNTVPGALGHVLIASVINVVGAVFVSRIMVPPAAEGDVGQVPDQLAYGSLMDAITRGTGDGLRLAANVAAMVIVLVSLVALVNQVLGAFIVAEAPLTLERMMGWVFAPVAWLIGIPWAEAQAAGALLGTKLILNELLAYIQMAGLPEGTLSASSELVMIYALCGFANFGSLGILLGGLNTLVPERLSEVLEIGPKTLISGTIVTCNTGAIVALVRLI